MNWLEAEEIRNWGINHNLQVRSSAKFEQDASDVPIQQLIEETEE